MPYDKIANRYDKALAPFEKLFLSAWRRETLAFLPQNAELLEIGAGTGLNFRHYPKCRRSIACEISEQMLRIAGAKSALEQLSLVQADARVLPFADDSFDAALASLVFCSLDSPETAFAELCRVVKNRGRVVLLEHVRPPNPLGYLFDVLSLLTARLFADHFNRRTSEIAETAGLKILEIRKKAFGVVNLIICEIDK